MSIFKCLENNQSKTGRVIYELHSHAKKPNAFKNSQLREDLIPDGDFSLIWAILTAKLTTDSACHYMVSLLLISTNYDCEFALGRLALGQLELGNQLSIESCKQQFKPSITVPDIVATQHKLETYDELLRGLHG